MKRPCSTARPGQQPEPRKPDGNGPPPSVDCRYEGSPRRDLSRRAAGVPGAKCAPSHLSAGSTDCYLCCRSTSVRQVLCVVKGQGFWPPGAPHPWIPAFAGMTVAGSSLPVKPRGYSPALRQAQDERGERNSNDRKTLPLPGHRLTGAGALTNNSTNHQRAGPAPVAYHRVGGLSQYVSGIQFLGVHGC